jgi:2-keto-4-pentenoate hydratase/2-oxohepta-3-ene-1,7-dioic acid hydratase in catechol pathway
LRIARFVVDNCVKYGVVQGEKVVDVQGDIFGDFELQKSNFHDISQIKLLTPVVPSKIICVGNNYRDHAIELGENVREEPVLFLKPPTSLIGHDEDIIYPEISKRVDYEGELAVVMRSECQNILPDQVKQHIFGCTCANDVTARDLQRRDGQWTRSKSFDTFCPLGPWIETELDPNNLKIQTFLNGQIRQSSSTSMMITPVYELISFISKVMTLMPGDVILTGTPAGVGPVRRGDVVEVSIEGIGTLKNRVY